MSGLSFAHLFVRKVKVRLKINGVSSIIYLLKIIYIRQRRMNLKIVAFLRGVTPIGKNKIPKMSYVVQILTQIGFKNVSTYIQSGNIILETPFSEEETAQKIHDIIFEKIGANLSVIVKHRKDLENAINQNPFDDDYEYSRIHLTFTNDIIQECKNKIVSETDFGDEIYVSGNSCFYMYLPRESKTKKLGNNYLEKKLDIVATTRKLSVIKKLYEML